MFVSMYQPVILSYFRRQLEEYSKKYRHLKEAVVEALRNFRKEANPHLGHNIYKVRLKTKDIPRGKSNSFRLIVLIIEVDQYIVPMTLYFKGDQEDISKKELNNHLENVLWELRMQHV
jgi:hypothetical protein